MISISLSVGVGLICALLSALGTNLAFLFKQRGAVAAPDVDMRHPARSAIALFRSKWWSVGWAVAAVAFALHVAALTLAPISIGQAVLAGGLVFLAVLAERFFGFDLGSRQWTGIGLVAVSLTALTLTGAGSGGEANSGYSLAGMIVFESIAVGVGSCWSARISSSASGHSPACSSASPPGSGSGSPTSRSRRSPAIWTAVRPAP